jgi:hypothetical protein
VDTLSFTVGMADPGLNARVFALERRGNRGRLAANGCPVEPPRYTPIWKLEAALKCRSRKKGRYAPPVHMIELTATQQITPYKLGASGRGTAELPI